MITSILITFVSCFFSGIGLGYLITVIPRFLLHVQSASSDFSSFFL